MHGPQSRQLPIRLGLPEYPQFEEVGEIDYICFCISSDKLTNPSCPSIFDATYVPAKAHWHPGGRTVPLPWGPSECIAAQGLLEIVADAPKYHELEDGVTLVRGLAVNNDN